MPAHTRSDASASPGLNGYASGKKIFLRRRLLNRIRTSRKPPPPFFCNCVVYVCRGACGGRPAGDLADRSLARKKIKLKSHVCVRAVGWRILVDTYGIRSGPEVLFAGC